VDAAVEWRTSWTPWPGVVAGFESVEDVYLGSVCEWRGAHG